MINFLILVLILVIVSLLTGFVVSRLHFAVGSPDLDGYNPTRIFSFYGRYVSERYKAQDDKENRRIGRIFADWSKVFESVCKREMEAMKGEVEAHEIEGFRAGCDAKKEVKFESLERRKKINIWKAFGCCLECFAYWASGAIGVVIGTAVVLRFGNPFFFWEWFLIGFFYLGASVFFTLVSNEY